MFISYLPQNKPHTSLLFLTIFYWLCYQSCPIFSSYYPLPPWTLRPHLPSPFSSCPWVVHVSSWASPFPTLFLTSPCLFCTYQLCFLFPVSFSPSSPFPRSTDNPPRDLHFCDSVPVLVVCLVCLFFYVQLFIVMSLLSLYCS